MTKSIGLKGIGSMRNVGSGRKIGSREDIGSRRRKMTQRIEASSQDHGMILRAGLGRAA
jgi:hypothetical protein